MPRPRLANSVDVLHAIRNSTSTPLPAAARTRVVVDKRTAERLPIQGRRMKAVRRALRKHLSPLGGDTVTMLNLPPVRMGLLTKLNLLTIGLIFLTAVAITGFYFTQRWRDAEQELKTQGASMLGMMAELAEYGVYTSDRASLEQMLDSMGADPDVAYVAVLDMQQQVLAERRFAPGAMKSALPALPANRFAFGTGRIATQEIVVDGQRYIELVVPIDSPLGSGSDLERRYAARE